MQPCYRVLSFLSFWSFSISSCISHHAQGSIRSNLPRGTPPFAVWRASFSVSVRSTTGRISITRTPCRCGMAVSGRAPFSNSSSSLKKSYSGLDSRIRSVFIFRRLVAVRSLLSGCCFSFHRMPDKARHGQQLLLVPVQDKKFSLAASPFSIGRDRHPRVIPALR